VLVELTGPLGSAALPPLCASCGSAAGQRLQVEKVFRRKAGTDVPATYVVSSVSVPFCGGCVARHQAESPPKPVTVRALTLLRSVLMIPAVSFALITLWLLPRFFDNGGLLFGGILLAFALLSVACLRAAWAQTHRYRVAELSSVTGSFDFTDDLSELFERERHNYLLRNPTFAEAFNAANADQVWDPASPGARRADRARSGLLIAVVLVGVVYVGYLVITALL
jgi:hypothetical protein